MFTGHNRGLCRKCNKIHKNNSEKLKGIKTQPCSEETKRKISIGNTGKILSKEIRQKISNSKSGKSSKRKEFYHTNETKTKIRMSLAETRKLHPELLIELGRKNCINTKLCWQNPEYKERTIKSIMKGNYKKQINKQETTLFNLIQQISPDYSFNSYQNPFVIGGRLPDFVNIHGQKKLIEHLGIYWHLWRIQKSNPNYTKQDEENKIQTHYKQFGYDCLCIWEDELKNQDKVIEKIKDFNNNRG